MGHRIAEVTRSHCLGLLERFHALAMLFPGLELDFQGDREEGGCLYSDGQGNNLYGNWDASRMVLLGWVHDLEAPRRYTARRWHGLPQDFRALAKEAFSWDSFGGATSVLWFRGEQSFAEADWQELMRLGLGLLGDLSESFPQLTADRSQDGRISPRERWTELSAGDYAEALRLGKELEPVLLARDRASILGTPPAPFPASLQPRLFTFELEPLAARRYAEHRVRKLSERGFQLELPKKFLPSEAELAAARAQTAQRIKLLDIELVPNGAGFRLIASTSVFRELYVLSIDERTVFFGYTPEEVLFLRAFTADGAEVLPEGIEAVRRHDDFSLNVRQVSGEVLELGLLANRCERLPRERYLSPAAALPQFQSRWPQLRFSL